MRSPRSASQAANGSALPPVSLRSLRTFAISLFGPETTPRSRSPWPLMYLVAECTLKIAPRSMGRCRSGVAKVASTTSGTPRARQTAAMPSRSATRKSGLVMDSRCTTRVCVVMAASMAAGVAAGASVQVAPKRARCSVRNACVTPYNPSMLTTCAPAPTYARIAAEIAPIPDEKMHASSVISSSAMAWARRSSVGLASRE